MPRIILASSSKYRRAQLESIGIEPVCISPDADEDSISPDDHTPQEVAEKRAELKMQAIQPESADDIIVASDQLGHLDGHILGKPKTFEKAVEQLQSMSGKTHELITAMQIRRGDQFVSHTDITYLTMKSLSKAEIESYVRLDEPLDCAGAYKIENHGLWLFDKIVTEDHTSITGLPLLAFIKIATDLGYRKL